MSGILVHRQKRLRLRQMIYLPNATLWLNGRARTKPSSPSYDHQFLSIFCFLSPLPCCVLTIFLCRKWLKYWGTDSLELQSSRVEARRVICWWSLVRAPGPCICCPHCAAKAAVPVPGTLGLLRGNLLEWNVGAEHRSALASVYPGNSKWEGGGKILSPRIPERVVFPFASTLGKWQWQSWDPAPEYHIPFLLPAFL